MRCLAASAGFVLCACDIDLFDGAPRSSPSDSRIDHGDDYDDYDDDHANADGTPLGDWVALTVADDQAVSAASGILELDRDGWMLIDIDMAGQGPAGSLFAKDDAVVDLSDVNVNIVGRWTDATGPTVVALLGSCWTVSSDRLLCDLDVGEQSWRLEFIREID